MTDTTGTRDRRDTELHQNSNLYALVSTKKTKTGEWAKCKFHLIRDFYLEYKEFLHINRKGKKKTPPNSKMGRGTEQTFLRRIISHNQHLKMA